MSLETMINYQADKGGAGSGSGAADMSKTEAYELIVEAYKRLYSSKTDAEIESAALGVVGATWAGADAGLIREESRQAGIIGEYRGTHPKSK